MALPTPTVERPPDNSRLAGSPYTVLSPDVRGRAITWACSAGVAALADMAARVISPTVARQAGPFFIRVFIFIFQLFEVLGSPARAPTKAWIDRVLAADAPVEIFGFRF